MEQFAEIPIRIDFFSILIFLGVVQGLFLSLIFFVQQEENPLPYRLLGFCTLVLSLLSFEIFLGYTNLIMKVLHLVDFSETIVFLLGPFFYLYVKAKLDNEYRISRMEYLHFLIFALYSMYFIIFLIQPETVKYNAFITMFHPDLPHVTETFGGDPLRINTYHGILFLTHAFTYSILALIEIIRAFNNLNLNFLSNENRNLVWLRNIAVQIVVSFLIILIIKWNYSADLGDYLAAVWIAIMLYSMSFIVIKQSLFFRLAEGTKKKYSKSSLSDEQVESIVNKLSKVMTEEKLYLDESISLPVLAKKLATSQHHLSQALNDSLNKSFFEYIAELRIEEAKKVLSEEDSKNKTIDEIAYAVGYNSKSAFNTAFKKFTGQTPAKFRG